MKITLVYGNHGKAPAQLEDYFGYLAEAFKACGKEVVYSEGPLRGTLNVLIECFDEQFVRDVELLSSQTDTKFIVIATEFITGETFNSFVDVGTSSSAVTEVPAPVWIKSAIARGVPLVTPSFLLSIMSRLLPGPYRRLRNIYRVLSGYSEREPKTAEEYLLNRFKNFDKISRFCESIWCVTAHQLDPYIQRYGSQKVHQMPLVSWSPEVTNEARLTAEKDIDFLFTGSLTPYRERLLDLLKSEGYRVVVGPPILPGFLRDHYIARSKICLQIRQDPTWKYPSVMRYHYLLSSGALVVAERGVETCFHEDFLVTAEPSRFLEVCRTTLAQGGFSEKGLALCRDYYYASEEGRSTFLKLINGEHFLDNARPLVET
jgi:hypothetical protein